MIEISVKNRLTKEGQHAVYTRDQIITMVVADVYTSKREQQKRLNTIVDWLCCSLRAVRCLEWISDFDNGDFFLNRELNLTTAKSTGPFGGYSYNTMTAIMLALLLDTYEHPFLTSLLKDKYVYSTIAEEWMTLIEHKIDNYEKYWKDSEENEEWEIVVVNICSQLNRLTLQENNSDILKAIDQKVSGILINFLSLPDDKKAVAYEQINRRLDWISNKLEIIIKDLDPIDKKIFDWNHEELHR